MFVFIARTIITLIGLVIMYGSIGQCDAANFDESCVSESNVTFYQTLHDSSGNMIWLATDNSFADMCINLGGCYWKITHVPMTDLGLLEKYADPAAYSNRASRCEGPEPHWVGGQVWTSECKLEQQLEAALTLPVHWISNTLRNGERGCGTRDSPLENIAFILSGGGLAGPTLVLQALTSRSCFAILFGLSDLTSSILFRASCLTSNDEAKTSVADIVQHLSADAHWFGAQHSPFGFAISIPFAIGDRPAAKVWGGLEEAYVSKWLGAVAVAAATPSVVLASKDDPVPSANNSDFSGRLAKWIVAGLVRVSAKPFDQQGTSKETEGVRNWMARNALSASQDLSSTIFRVELARRDWTK